MRRQRFLSNLLRQRGIMQQVRQPGKGCALTKTSYFTFTRDLRLGEKYPRRITVRIKGPQFWLRPSPSRSIHCLEAPYPITQRRSGSWWLYHQNCINLPGACQAFYRVTIQVVLNSSRRDDWSGRVFSASIHHIPHSCIELEAKRTLIPD